MLRRLVLAGLPVLVLTAASASARMPTIVGEGAMADGYVQVSVASASLDARRDGGVFGASELSLDGAAFLSADGGGRGMPAVLDIGASVDGGTGPAMGQAAFRRASVGTASVKPGKVARLPEPATWAMMTFGFGLIGWAVRRGLRKSDERFNERVRRIASGDLE